MIASEIEIYYKYFNNCELFCSLVISCTERAPVEAESNAVYGSRQEMVVGRLRRSHWETEQVVPSLLSDDDRRGHMMPSISRDQAPPLRHTPIPRRGYPLQPPPPHICGSPWYNERRPSNNS